MEYIIPKDRKLPKAQDYDFLRRLGAEYIEKLGNKFWTDYNPHDPGITTMEVLAYVITELGYRADFKIGDLLTDKAGAISNRSFFSADKILVNAPLTEIDYRKLLIDINGVANAWFLATKKATDASGFFMPNDGEKDIYLNVLEDKLSFKNTDRRGDSLEQLKLRGLNKVVIELDEDPGLGNLNSTILDYEFLDEFERWIQTIVIPQDFTSWNDEATLLIKTLRDTPGTIAEAFYNPENRLILEVSNTAVGIFTFRIDVVDSAEAEYVKEHITERYMEILGLYVDKKARVDEVFDTINQTLQANRNLTEDCLDIDTINAVQIGVCAKIELKPQTNIADVMAQVQIAINEVLHPTVKFYTLGQLTEEGLHSDEIFSGPRLQHGFLKDDDVINSQLPTAIHTSDIIAAVMKVDGVASISDVLLTAYDQNGTPDPANSNVPWCLHLSGDVRPVFDIRRSRLQLYQSNIPLLISETNQRAIDQKINIYKAYQYNLKLQKPQLSYNIAPGTFYQLDEYYSIQDDYPATYGLGMNKLPEGISETRKAQVKQLQGYLYFYEQILADFFSQIYNAKNLLNTETLRSTYFPEYIDKNDLTGGTFYSADVLSADLAEHYKVSDGEQVSMYENREQFFDRRNRSLDHLIARFGESFNDYVFMMYKVQQDTTGLGELGKENVELIQDKQNFLNSYPEISSTRSLGLNYTLKPVEEAGYSNYWNTSNIGGYSKRAAKLLGINEWPLQPYMYNDKSTYFVLNIDNEPVFFRFTNPQTDLPEKKKWANENITNEPAYKISAIDNGDPDKGFEIHLVDVNKEILSIDKIFKEEDDAKTFIHALIAILNSPYEYFYCLEHILLRPFVSMNEEEDPNDPERLSDLLPVCLQDDCKDPANNDPYSFKASIVLPGWMGRFSNMYFREYAEKIFRQEAPAHVLLKICWVNEGDMKSFKEAFDKWFATYNDFRKAEKTDTTLPVVAEHLKHHRDLLYALKYLNTTYPEGHLYDCHNSETSNPIILGNTVLGNLNN